MVVATHENEGCLKLRTCCLEQTKSFLWFVKYAIVYLNRRPGVYCVTYLIRYPRTYYISVWHVTHVVVCLWHINKRVIKNLIKFHPSIILSYILQRLIRTVFIYKSFWLCTCRCWSMPRMHTTDLLGVRKYPGLHHPRHLCCLVGQEVRPQHGGGCDGEHIDLHQEGLSGQPGDDGPSQPCSWSLLQCLPPPLGTRWGQSAWWMGHGTGNRSIWPALPYNW